MADEMEIAWLIERGLREGNLQWWCGGDLWLCDANCAVRLCRKQDARDVIHGDPSRFDGALVREHAWGIQPVIEHRCGVNGFDRMLGHICPACDASRQSPLASLSRERTPT